MNSDLQLQPCCKRGYTYVFLYLFLSMFSSAPGRLILHLCFSCSLLYLPHVLHKHDSIFVSLGAELSRTYRVNYILASCTSCFRASMLSFLNIFGRKIGGTVPTKRRAKKASIPSCFLNMFGKTIGGTVPKENEHSVLFV